MKPELKQDADEKIVNSSDSLAQSKQSSNKKKKKQKKKSLFARFGKQAEWVSKKLQYCAGYLFLIPLSFVIPKKKNTVMLISRHGDFEGNLEYLFLYLNGLKDEKAEFVFLTDKKSVYRNMKKQGFKALLYPRFSTVVQMLRTSVVIVDGNEWALNLRYFYLFKAKKIQVWHGTGLKAIALLKPNIATLSLLLKSLKKEFTYYDRVVFSSPYQVEKRGKAFRYDQVIINGNPRNDYFFNKDLFAHGKLGCDFDLIAECLKLKAQGFSLVTYAPTWRQDKKNFDSLDFAELNDFAAKNMIIFIVKLHLKQRTNYDLSLFSNIREYKRDADIYPLLAETDLMVTDYSSIYLDFLLLNKPIIFYTFDRDKYIGNERELVFDFDQVTPGPKVQTQSDLQQELYKHLVDKQDEYSLLRDEVRAKFFYHTDGNSCERLWNKIKADFIEA